MKKLSFELRITVFYLLLGGLWIAFSDTFFHSLIDDEDVLVVVQMVKGWIYVLVTGVLFYIILRRHIMKLRQAEQKAIESDRLKSAFLANISHEVRTPMNGILGFLDMLKDPDLSTETKRDYIELLERSGYRLITVMTDILDISAIQSETVNPEKRTTDIIQIFEESADFYKSDLETKGLKLNFIKPYGDSPLLIETDEKLLKKIICKLLGNSIKFSDKGEIDIGYEINAGLLTIYVRDNGIGIQKEKLEAIFNRFEQADTRLSSPYQGAGLGLSIAKAYVHILGGDIWAESEPGRGSSFYVSFRYRSFAIFV